MGAEKKILLAGHRDGPARRYRADLLPNRESSMALTFYYGSGSPYAWRVWLALEHKGIAYELMTLSFSAGDLKKPEYLKVNPRHKVPAITDGELALYDRPQSLNTWTSNTVPARSYFLAIPNSARWSGVWCVRRTSMSPTCRNGWLTKCCSHRK